MSAPEHKQPSSPAAPMIGVLGGIALLSGFLVVFVYQITKPMIEENQRRAIEKAIFNVIPNAKAHSEFIVTKDGVKPYEKGMKGDIVYAGYDEKGNLTGFAAKAAAQGYAGMIYMLYGYDHECACIRGIEVLKMIETPGLGDKIVTDPRFTANFNALDAKLNAEGTALANAIVTVKHGTKKNPWEIDAISGATISSKTVGKALNNSAQSLLPPLLPQLDMLKEGAPPPAPVKEEAK